MSFKWKRVKRQVFAPKKLENHTNEGKERATGEKGGEEKKDSFGRFVFFVPRDSFWPKKKGDCLKEEIYPFG